MYFDRFDICEAYLVLEWDWHSGGWLHERPSNVRRGQRRGYVGESTDVQLSRMRFKPRPNLSYSTLSANAREIYHAAAERFGLSPLPVPFYECGGCGRYHPADWYGDCREDTYRWPYLPEWATEVDQPEA